METSNDLGSSFYSFKTLLLSFSLLTLTFLDQHTLAHTSTFMICVQVDPCGVHSQVGRNHRHLLSDRPDPEDQGPA